MEWWQVRRVLNGVNGSTLLGLTVGSVGRCRFRGGPRGLVLASGYRLPLPAASAFTLGDVVLTRHEEGWLLRHPRLLAHEERHSTQYAVCLGLPMLPLYAVAAAWSYVRGGDYAAYNVFERVAGLADGGYPAVSRRARRDLRPPRSA